MSRFGDDAVDHHTYVIAGDGPYGRDQHEAVSLAGALKLAKLIVLFDDNDICIDGPTNMAVIDDQPARLPHPAGMQSIDGHKDAVAAAIGAAQADRPSMIACKTVIGRGAPNKEGPRQLMVLWGTKKSHWPVKPWAGRICHSKYPKTAYPSGAKPVRGGDARAI